MRLFTAAVVAALLACPSAMAQSQPSAEGGAAVPPPSGPAAQPDPLIWLEDVESPRALAWVKAQNARSSRRLEGDRRFETFRKQALAILTATDRIPMPTFRAGGVDNFWQDEAQVKGVWRHASLASYRTAKPEWRTLIDFDALSKAEGRNWIFKGADCLKPAQTVCLVRLSDGGSDAVEIREFDAAAGRFIAGGFHFSTGKQYVEWLDHDTLLVGRDWTGDGASLTDSGYPFVLKVLKRSQPLDQARQVYRGRKADVSVQPTVLRGEGGRVDAVIAQRGLSFYDSEFYLIGDGQPVRLPWPKKTTLQGYVDGQVAFTLQEDWNGFEEGDLLAYDLAALKANPAAAKPVLIARPGPTQAIENVAATKNRLVVELLENVRGAVDVYAHGPKGWSRTRLDLPKDAAISIRDTSEDDDRLFLTSEGFLTPTSLWAADAAAGKTEQIKALPARFEADDTVEQFWATSSDGAKIPYFVVRPRAAKLDGSTPTIMYGYGGFQVSKPPAYIPEMGKLWLERGGAYVIANIRGGGEFGPRWHQSVLREHRQLAFDDFAAVARDLTKRGITSPRRLGIYGRSNGGVLTSVSMTQHPELYNAVVIESPLIDMLRYHKLSAGASWVGEYGNPDVPADYAFIARYSGYQNLKPGVKYPEPYITTNTKDDRVHPGHARKFAAKMEALGAPYLYYEQTFGGHANDADPQLNAGRWARHYVYLSQKLMD